MHCRSNKGKTHITLKETNMKKNILEARSSSIKTNKYQQENKIEELRQLARTYIDENNKLITELWDIDLKIAQIKSDENNVVLFAEKDEINNKIKLTNYEEKINNILEKIKTLEIASYGYSNIGSNSPYQL